MRAIPFIRRGLTAIGRVALLGIISPFVQLLLFVLSVVTFVLTAPAVAALRQAAAQRRPAARRPRHLARLGAQPCLWITRRDRRVGRQPPCPCPVNLRRALSR